MMDGGICRIGHQLIGPLHQFRQLAKKSRDLIIREQRRQLEFLLCEFQIHRCPFPAPCGCAAKRTPVSRAVIAFARISQPGFRLKFLPDPLHEGID